MFTMCEYAKLIVPTGSRPGRAGICRGVGTDGPPRRRSRHGDGRLHARSTGGAALGALSMNPSESSSRETLTRQQRNMALAEPIARLSLDRRVIFKDDPVDPQTPRRAVSRAERDRFRHGAFCNRVRRCAGRDRRARRRRPATTPPRSRLGIDGARVSGAHGGHVIAAMEANHPHLTTQKSLYVEISRARDRAELVTDDAERLAGAARNCDRRAHIGSGRDRAAAAGRHRQRAPTWSATRPGQRRNETSGRLLRWNGTALARSAGFASRRHRSARCRRIGIGIVDDWPHDDEGMGLLTGPSDRGRPRSHT